MVSSHIVDTLVHYLTQGGTFGDSNEAREAVEALYREAVDEAGAAGGMA